MSVDLTPSPIVAEALQLAHTLEAWARTHRRSTLAEHEQAVLQLVRACLGRFLGGVLTRALRLDHPLEQQRRCPCPTCGRRCGPHQQRARQPLTVCGPTPVVRAYYYCAWCRQGWAPADQVLGLAAQQRLSVGLQTWLATEGADSAFGAAAARIERLTGIGVGAETVRTHTEAVGQVLVAQQTADAQQVQATQAAAEPLDPAPDTLLVEADGGMLHYRDDWHEVKIGLVAGCTLGNGRAADDPTYRPPRLRAPSYVAARLEARAFGPVLLAEAARRGALEVVGWEQPPGTDPRLAGVCGPALAVLRRVIVLGDGARWIWELAATCFGERIEIVDWYHASEHLWDVGRALHGADGPHTATWVRRAEAVLWGRGAAALVPHLRRSHGPTPDREQVRVREAGYFDTNTARMAYPTFRAAGLPIGSGAIESGVQLVAQQRCKQPGMRWSHPGAQAVLAVRAHVLSKRPLPAAPVHRRAAA